MKNYWRWAIGSTETNSTQDSFLDDKRERFNLGMFRIWYFAIVFFTMANKDYFLNWIEVPSGFWFPRGVFFFYSSPPSGAWLTALFYVWKWTTVLCAIGFLYRVVAPIWWLSCLFVTTYAHSFGYQGHFFMPVVLAGLPFAFSSSAASFGFDGWVLHRRKKTLPVGTAFADRLTIRSIQLILVSTYFAAGLAKLRFSGFEWITSDTLRNYLVFSSVLHADINMLAHIISLNDFLIRFPFLCKFLAGFAVTIEILAPTAFFWRRFAYFIIPMIVALQIGIFFAIYVNFVPYTALIGAWINWHFFKIMLSKLLRKRVLIRD